MYASSKNISWIAFYNDICSIDNVTLCFTNNYFIYTWSTFQCQWCQYMNTCIVHLHINLFNLLFKFNKELTKCYNYIDFKFYTLRKVDLCQKNESKEIKREMENYLLHYLDVVRYNDKCTTRTTSTIKSYCSLYSNLTIHYLLLVYRLVVTKIN